MRRLTFLGFLARYTRDLSYAGTNNIRELAREAAERNPRLREPLLLYALYSGKENHMLKEAERNGMGPFYDPVLPFLLPDKMTDALEKDLLPNEYTKVWRSYLAKRDWLDADNGTKELIREKVLELQTERHVSNYRIYTDLHLNPGNVNAWLKHGDNSKISLGTARRVLDYLRQQPVI